MSATKIQNFYKRRKKIVEKIAIQTKFIIFALVKEKEKMGLVDLIGILIK